LFEYSTNPLTSNFDLLYSYSFCLPGNKELTGLLFNTYRL